MNRRQVLGIGILSLVGLTLAGFIADDEPAIEQITVTGYAGNLKIPLLNDPEVVKILHDQYGLTVEAEGAATTDMLCNFDLSDTDFLWAGDQTQIAIYEQCNNRRDPYQNLLLNPMVFYSWTEIVDALIKEGVVQVSPDGIYTVNMVAMLDLLNSGKHWTDLGFQDITSKIVVQPADPDTANSGRQFAGLMANSLNCVEVVNSASVDSILPGINSYYQQLGFLEPSSDALFKNFLTIGPGGYPLAALLENQISTFLTDNPDSADQVSDNIRMIYPQPTIWATHPMIARTDGGKQLMKALQDQQIQQIAWSKYGFRPAVPGVQIDVAALPVKGVAQEITSVIDLPSDEVMNEIIAATKELPPGVLPSAPVCPVPSTTALGAPAVGPG